MLREIAYCLLGLAIAAYSLEYVLAAGDDPKEPARLRSGPPLVGHIIGIYRHGMAYFSKTWCVSSWVIYFVPRHR